MKRLLLIAFILIAAKVSFSQNYLLLSTGATGPSGTGNSVIYQDPATSNIGIGNATPQASLHITGVVGLTGAPYVIESGYTPGTGTAPGYFTGIRGVAGGTGPFTDFDINAVGQTAIGDASNTSIDLWVHTHNWPSPGNPLAPIQVDDDNSMNIFSLQNLGNSGNSCGFMKLKSNSTLSGNPAFSILDISGNLNPMFQVTSDGFVGIGVDPTGVGYAAQLDIVLNNNGTLVDNLLHVGNGTPYHDFFTINNNGSVGIGQENPGDAILEVSDVNNLASTGEEQLMVDDGHGHTFFNINGSATNGTYVGIGQQNLDHALLEVNDVNNLGSTGLPLMEVDYPGGWVSPYFSVFGTYQGADFTGGTGGQVGIGTTPLTTNSTLTMQGIGTTCLDIVAGTSDGTGSSIKFWGAGFNLRHMISDNLANDNLVIQPDCGDGMSGSKHILEVDGNLQIGTTSETASVGSGGFTNWSLSVAGQIVAKEIVVTTSNWADTVFSTNYQLKPLADVESYIQRNHHLPDVPAADEVVCTGISLGDMNKILMQKVEELTLYVLKQQKEIDELKKKQER